METASTTGLRHVDSTASVQEILQIVAEDGGVRIKGLLSADQVARLNAEIDPVLGTLAPGSTHEDEFIRDFHGVNTKRLTNLVTHSKTFREEVLTHPLVMDVADAVFLEESGSYWLTTAQVIQIGPGNPAQMLHRDLEQFHPFIGMGPSGPEVMINFMIALTPYTPENGATRVIPGSHRWSDYEDRGEPADTVPAEMDAGDVFFFSGKTAHGGGANLTQDEYRRGVAFAFQPGYLVPEEAYPFLIDMDIVKSMSPRAQQLIGFRSHFPKGSPGVWQVDYSELADYLGL